MFKKYLKTVFTGLLIFLIAQTGSAFAEDESQMVPRAGLAKENNTDYPTIYKESSRKISVINPTIFNNPSAKIYPGLRGGNQLVIYTPKFGQRTQTNEFGSEAIVINGVVTQVNGADSIIPPNGYVISGHGSAKNWINENITVGTNVELDATEGVLRVYVTSDSFIYNAKVKINEVQNILDDYVKMNVPTNSKKAVFYISKSKEYISKAKKDEKNVQKYSSAAIMAADKALEQAIPYIAGELKGVWIRPTETSLPEVQRTVVNLKNAGITDVFLETYYHGTTIYPSNYLAKRGVVNQKAEFRGFDPLAAWINTAHANNIKVHIWFETFYVGNEYSANNPYHILNVHANWRNTNKAHYDSDTPCASASEHNGYFIDPANPEVQVYLLGLLKEIITKYKPDGINLDYIRYPQSLISKYPGYVATNWGYTEYARKEFEDKYGIDPIDITYPSADWDKWSEYRQKKITDFVKKTQHLCKQHKVMLSTVVFPDQKRCLETKMQNWSLWSRENLIDALTPLILTCDKQTSVLLIKDILRNTSNQTMIYPGLFVPFMGGQPNDLLRQIHENRKLRNGGLILFDYAHFDDRYINTLMASAFKESEKSASIEDLLRPESELGNTGKRFIIFPKKQKRTPILYFD